MDTGEPVHPWDDTSPKFTEEELAASVPERVGIGDTFTLMLDIAPLDRLYEPQTVWEARFTWVDDFQALFSITIESRRQWVSVSGPVNGYVSWQGDDLLIARGRDEFDAMAAVAVPGGFPGYDPDRDYADMLTEGWRWQELAMILVKALQFGEEAWPRLRVGAP
jgi:hypothetical protein